MPYVPDWRIDPPEDNREVVSRCAECNEDIANYQEIVKSDYLGLDFCDMDCLKSYLDIEITYYTDY